MHTSSILSIFDKENKIILLGAIYVSFWVLFGYYFYEMICKDMQCYRSVNSLFMRIMTHCGMLCMVFGFLQVPSLAPGLDTNFDANDKLVSSFY